MRIVIGDVARYAVFNPHRENAQAARLPYVSAAPISLQGMQA
jgi:hypothetical protein